MGMCIGDAYLCFSGAGVGLDKDWFRGGAVR